MSSQIISEWGQLRRELSNALEITFDNFKLSQQG